ncbi:ABC transporter substrate-binding protein [Methylobacterium oryzae CBMB20]
MGALGAARAEVSTVRLAKQFGISYLPLTVMEEEGLLEKQAKQRGLDVKAEWLRFTGGSGMNEALLSGNLDLASGGVGPFLTIWGRTQGNLKVKGVAALNAMPLWLVTTNPGVRSITDFGPQDKIALPTAKTSIQAITLQMAAEKAFGPGQQGKLDALTVSMGHPDAQTALMGGRSEITAHFGSPPFQEMELKDPRARKVLDSYDVMGGPHTFNLVWALQPLRHGQPHGHGGLPGGAGGEPDADPRRPGPGRGALDQGGGVEDLAGRGRRPHPRAAERLDDQAAAHARLPRLHEPGRAGLRHRRRRG